MPKYVVVMPFL